jgi:hypothetical protein
VSVCDPDQTDSDGDGDACDPRPNSPGDFLGWLGGSMQFQYVAVYGLGDPLP